MPNYSCHTIVPGGVQDTSFGQATLTSTPHHYARLCIINGNALNLLYLPMAV